MYKKVGEFYKEPIRGKILGISGINNFYPFVDMKNSELTEADYPRVDMQNLPYENGRFDFVISDQVIEHLEDPGKAVAESCRVLKKGGMAIHTTCFMNYIHPAPKDFWRFTPDGLRCLCKDFTEILFCEGWGNRFTVALIVLSNRFRHMRIPDTKWSMRNFIANYNEERYPIVTWIIARK